MDPVFTVTSNCVRTSKLLLRIYIVSGLFKLLSNAIRWLRWKLSGLSVNRCRNCQYLYLHVKLNQKFGVCLITRLGLTPMVAL